MSFAFIQSSSATPNADPSADNYDSSVTAGSLLIAAVFWNQTGETCSVSDSVNGAWTAIGSPTNGANSLASYRRQMFYLASTAAGNPTVTASFSGSGVNSSGIAIHEYSHTGGAISLDGTPVYDNVKDAGGFPSTSAVVTTVAGDLGFSVCIAQTAVVNSGPGWALRESAQFGSNGTEDDTDLGTAGSKTATWSVNSNDDTMLGLVAFQEASAAAASGQYPATRLLSGVGF